MTQSEVFGFTGGPVSVPTGGGSALLMTAFANQVGWQLKYVSGGSLEIHGAASGATANGLAVSGSSGYLLSTTEVEYISGPARFYLVATGSTAVAHILRPLSSGF